MPTLPPRVGFLTPEDSFPAHPSYFKSLLEFRKYYIEAARDKPASTLPPVAEPLPAGTERRRQHGTLTVCHDMRGGYVQDAHKRMWAMPWWGMADSFIYFSHHRVSLPPREWINAGHRQGCRVLGTIIFEGDGEQDFLRLHSGFSAEEDIMDPHVPTFCKSYADALVDICVLRGFDGFLVNVEISPGLPGGARQAQVLRDWLQYFTKHARNKLDDGDAERAEIIWYDSITKRADLNWQNCLNAANSSFFEVSSAIFTNYFWTPAIGSPTAPALSVEYFNNLRLSRSATDIQIGVDMWGTDRYQYGGGGLRCYRALESVYPREIGLSVGLFGPGWIYEKFENEAWSRRWEREQLLWVGRESTAEEEIASFEFPGLYAYPKSTAEFFDVTESNPARDVFRPIKHYFPIRRQKLPFSTTFSLGSGSSFYTEGEPVHEPFEWSDHELVTPLPDLAMPTAAAVDIETKETVVLACSWTGESAGGDVWFGGQSLKLTCPQLGRDRRIFIPLFSLDLDASDGCLLEADVIWKSENMPATNTVPAVRMETDSLKLLAKTIELEVPAESSDPGSASRWTRSRSILNGENGQVAFGVVALFITSDPYIVIGGASIRRGQRESLYPTFRNSSQTSIDNLHLTRISPTTGTVGWTTSGAASRAFMKYAVTADVPGSPEARLVFWTMSGMQTVSFSWRDEVVRTIIKEKGVRLKVQAYDGLGCRSGLADYKMIPSSFFSA